MLELERFLPLLGDKELDLFLVEPEIKKIYLLYLNVEIAEPFVDVAIVLLFDVLELVRGEVDASVENRHLEFASIDLEIAIDDREGAPADHYILRDVLFGGQIHDLKHYNVGWQQT